MIISVMLFQVKITKNNYISNVFALKRVVRRRMYDTYGHTVESPEIVWNYLAWPISDSPVLISETSTIGKVIVIPKS